MEKVATGNALLNPKNVLKEGDIGFGQVVADLGTGGAGYFALQAAKMVGDRGRVYAVDVLKSALSNVTSRARMMGLTNIIPIWTNLEILGGAKEIANNSIDVGILVNVLHQSINKSEHVLTEAKRMLKKDGKLIIVDWNKSGSPVGPGVHSRISKNEILESAKKVGLTIDREFVPGEFHWGVVVKK